MNYCVSGLIRCWDLTADRDGAISLPAPPAAPARRADPLSIGRFVGGRLPGAPGLRGRSGAVVGTAPVALASTGRVILTAYAFGPA